MATASRSGRRTLGLTVVVAAGSMAVGFLAAAHITSPGEAAARAAAPEASVITVPVERRELRSDVITRGDAVFDDAVDVRVLTGGLELPAIVTGAVPEVGGTLDAGDLALEIVGRPVIVLPGDLPTYRTLGPGMSGPDVHQLKQALEALDLDPGDVDDDRYDAATAAAVRRLYERVGYPPPAVPEALAARLDGARDAVTAAEAQVRSAEQVLAAASRPPSQSARLSADAQVASAERQLARARESGDDDAVAAAEDQLRIAMAQRDDLLRPPDLTAERAAVSAARQELAGARGRLADAETAAATHLPAAEVVHLAGLPRRVDRVMTARGFLVDGPVISVSGADLVVVAALSSGDRQLVDVGMAAWLDVDGSSVEAVIERLGEGTGSSWEAVLRPVDLAPEAAGNLRGRNVRVTIPVRTTDGEVLTVPLAALTAGPAGESRVEAERRDGAFGLVEVEVGLVAGGVAEVRAVQGELEVGDLVVVGR